MKQVDDLLLARLSTAARGAARQRSNYNLHPVLEDRVQRFLNAMEPRTYVCPHRHEGADRWELFLAIKGCAAVLTFDEEGVVRDRVELSPQGPVYALEIPGDTWHTVVALTAGTILYETKEGPYRPSTDKDFAPWAPREGDPHCAIWRDWLPHAAPGMAAPKPAPI
jgi:cupin fold WbuC family metalloprotein